MTKLGGCFLGRLALGSLMLASFVSTDVVFADPARGIIVDNEDKAGYREEGSWKTVRHGRAYGMSYRVNRAGSGKDKAIFTPVLRQPGTYKVYVKYGFGRGQGAKVKYQVYHSKGVAQTVVDQSKNSGRWNLLGSFSYKGSNNIRVVLSDDASSGKVVASDAVSFVLAAPLEVIVDNTDMDFLSSSSWKSSRRAVGYAGADYKVRKVGREMDVARWRATLTDAGRYEVFARWTSGDDRSTAAPYLVFHKAGVSRVTIDQSHNGNKWVSLGVYDLPAGSMTRVALSNWTASGKYVVADAVRFVSQGQVDPYVKIESPDHMGSVPNPVSVTFRAGGCVQSVRFGIDGKLLHGDPLSVGDANFTYTFQEINRAHYLTVTGYDAHGIEVARDQIVFTPERTSKKHLRPGVRLAERQVAIRYLSY